MPALGIPVPLEGDQLQHFGAYDSKVRIAKLFLENVEGDLVVGVADQVLVQEVDDREQGLRFCRNRIENVQIIGFAIPLPQTINHGIDLAHHLLTELVLKELVLHSSHWMIYAVLQKRLCLKDRLISEAVVNLVIRGDHNRDRTQVLKHPIHLVVFRDDSSLNHIILAILQVPIELLLYILARSPDFEASLQKHLIRVQQLCSATLK